VFAKQTRRDVVVNRRAQKHPIQGSGKIFKAKITATLRVICYA
jgi:hypothetical protein